MNTQETVAYCVFIIVVIGGVVFGSYSDGRKYEACVANHKPAECK